MASQSFPSTPKSIGGDAVVTPSPGTWRHPQLREIVRRQNAATFGDRNVRRILCNGGSLIVTCFLGNAFRQYFLWLGSLIHLSTHPDIIILVLRLFFLMNIVTALYPLYRPKDNFADIPLTPSQRALLGLDPNNTPPITPGTKYITPPRYRLSSGSLKASPNTPGSSPLSGKGSQSGGKLQEASPFSPSASPLFQKAIANGNRDPPRKQSFGSPSPLVRSGLKDGGILRTPTQSPVGGKSTNLVLTNKWLYEKSRVTAPNNSVFRQ